MQLLWDSKHFQDHKSIPKGKQNRNAPATLQCAKICCCRFKGNNSETVMFWGFFLHFMGQRAAGAEVSGNIGGWKLFQRKQKEHREFEWTTTEKKVCKNLWLPCQPCWEERKAQTSGSSSQSRTPTKFGRSFSFLSHFGNIYIFLFSIWARSKVKVKRWAGVHYVFSDPGCNLSLNCVRALSRALCKHRGACLR